MTDPFEADPKRTIIFGLKDKSTFADSEEFERIDMTVNADGTVRFSTSSLLSHVETAVTLSGADWRALLLAMNEAQKIRERIAGVLDRLSESEKALLGLSGEHLKDIEREAEPEKHAITVDGHEINASTGRASRNKEISLEVAEGRRVRNTFSDVVIQPSFQTVEEEHSKAAENTPSDTTFTEELCLSVSKDTGGICELRKGHRGKHGCHSSTSGQVWWLDAGAVLEGPSEGLSFEKLLSAIEKTSEAQMKQIYLKLKEKHQSANDANPENSERQDVEMVMHEDDRLCLLVVDLSKFRWHEDMFLSGRNRGALARKASCLDEYEKHPGFIQIKVPDNVEIDLSFFDGMFFKSIIGLGEEGFREKYKFTGLNISSLIDEAIERHRILNTKEEPGLLEADAENVPTNAVVEVKRVFWPYVQIYK